MRRNHEHEKDLELAHKMFDGRNLMTELRWQRKYLDTGYLSVTQVLFNKWIFDESLKRLGKLEKIEQIVNTAKAQRLTLDSQDIQAVCEILEKE